MTLRNPPPAPLSSFCAVTAVTALDHRPVAVEAEVVISIGADALATVDPDTAVTAVEASLALDLDLDLLLFLLSFPPINFSGASDNSCSKSWIVSWDCDISALAVAVVDVEGEFPNRLENLFCCCCFEVFSSVLLEDIFFFFLAFVVVVVFVGSFFTVDLVAAAIAISFCFR